MTGMVRRVIDAWGTTITVDVVAGPGSGDDQGKADLDQAMEAAHELCADIDRVFSPYRADSLVSALRRGEWDGRPGAGFAPDQAVFVDILQECERARSVTRGAFDPWVGPGGFDPSGLVKGSGAEQIADLFVARGFGNVCVNAAGDLSARGLGPAGVPWRVGITHPDLPGELCARVPVGWATDIAGPAGAVATSGFTEQRGHVVSPRTGGTLCIDEGDLVGCGVRQATVVGPDGGLADALATGLLIDGVDGAAWFDEFAALDLRIGRPHSRWGALIIDGGSMWRLGALSLPHMALVEP